MLLYEHFLLRLVLNLLVYFKFTQVTIIVNNN